MLSQTMMGNLVSIRPNWIGWPEPSGDQASEGMGRCVLFLLLVLGLPLKTASLAEG